MSITQEWRELRRNNLRNEEREPSAQISFAAHSGRTGEGSRIFRPGRRRYSRWRSIRHEEANILGILEPSNEVSRTDCFFRQLTRANLQAIDGKRPQQFGIVEVDRFSILRRDFERFEQGPVPDVVAVLGMVVDAVEPTLEHPARRALSEGPGSRPLKDGGVEFSYAQFQTIARQLLAEKTDPLAGMEVGATSTVFPPIRGF